MNPQQNNLSLLNYKFKLSRAPTLEYRVQSVSIPGITLGSADMPTPYGLRIPFSGNIAYDDLSVNFLVGENLEDYLEIHRWMIANGYPDSLSQYPGQVKDTVSDVSVMILNSAMRGVVNVLFKDAFPVQLSSIDFDATLSEVQYAQATVTFRYNRYYFNPIE